MEIESYIELIDRQHKFLCDLVELDGGCLDVAPDNWQRRGSRRGWTRADKRRYAAFQDQTPPHLRPVEPVGYRYPSTRQRTAMRLFDFEKPLVDASQRALAECKSHIELAELSPIVLRMTATHREWVLWLTNGEPSDVDARWESCRHELFWMVANFGMLNPTLRKLEWDRWRSLCSTEKRQALLDRFWLAKIPLSRSEIAPDAGTGFRRLVGEVNKLAATAKPPIKWEIRADSQTQKWSKHWFGG